MAGKADTKMVLIPPAATAVVCTMLFSRGPKLPPAKIRPKMPDRAFFNSAKPAMDYRVLANTLRERKKKKKKTRRK